MSTVTLVEQITPSAPGATKHRLYAKSDGRLYTLNPAGGEAQLAANRESAAIASAATINLDAIDGDFVHVTGTTTITAITLAQGAERTVVFDGVLTLTEGASLLLNNAGGNITTAAGDVFVFRGEGGGVTQRVGGAKKNGQAVAGDGSVQIQPISASVGAGALTISASALSLDFRSTTLGSGTVTRVSGTPANLVISSGSTLGTVNAVQSDIVVLAINNAGTIELAAVNLAGGVDLSETGLISTTAEGGAGAADSATVVYSTTARTSVAYRVLGIIRSTQATAGTWATTPSLIQGAGGQALTAMSSLGYGQTWQNVTGSRSLATNYYNTTGKPIVASCSIIYSTANAFVGYSGGNSIKQLTNTATTTQTLEVIVLPGQHYSFTNGGGSVSSWWELK